MKIDFSDLFNVLTNWYLLSQESDLKLDKVINANTTVDLYAEQMEPLSLYICILRTFNYRIVVSYKCRITTMSLAKLMTVLTKIYGSVFGRNRSGFVQNLFVTL